ncbi:MAG: hypothetical protein KDD92_07510 [Caldilineaceae bacterium]|nr:hypothetical protein [Caldilineaceae bacterium]
MSKTSIRYVAIMLICILTLSGCSSPVGSFLAPKPELPDRILYVVATGIEQNGRFHNELVLVDPEQWAVLRRTRLKVVDSVFYSINEDSLGRIWIPYHGAPGAPGNTVAIFNRDGSHLSNVETCGRPHSVYFIENFACVICAHNGFFGRVTMIELDTLDTVRELELEGNEGFFLTATATDGRIVIVWGADKLPVLYILGSSQPDTVPETVNYRVATQSILPIREEQFIVLNEGSNRIDYDEIIDGLFLDISEGDMQVKPFALPVRSPLWGVISDNMLFSYHNSRYADPKGTAERAMSRLDLETGDTDLWPLPDNWDARDLEIIDGRIMLTWRRSNDPEASGIYEFDPETGSLEQVMQLPGATLMLPPDD